MRVGIALSALGALFLLAGCMGGSPRARQTDWADIDPPAFSEGDSWVDNGTTILVRDVRTVMVQGENYTVHEEYVRDLGHCTVVGVRASDGAASWKNRGCQGENWYQEAFAEPCRGYWGHHQVGKAWNETCNWSIAAINHTTDVKTVFFRDVQHRSWEIVGLEEVSVPAGRFAAWHIRGEVSNTGSHVSCEEGCTWDEWYAPAACHIVRKTDEDGTWELGAAHCALGTSPRSPS